MATRLTQQEFIERATRKHEGRYDYSKTVYRNYLTPITITCNIHGLEFLTTPKYHLERGGCPICGGKHLRTKDFIENAIKIHGNKYDYSKAECVNKSTKVCIICKKCGHEFWQTPEKHLYGQGCPFCAGKLKVAESFIEKSKEIHGDAYDYSKVIYGGAKTKVTIICKECGTEFYQTPTNHLKGHGCPLCSKKKQGLSRRLKKEDFIEKSNIVHDFKYKDGYGLIPDTFTWNEKLPIVCPSHGLFYQERLAHMQGHGCPYCATSNGEIEVKKILDRMRILYIQQKKIPNESPLCDNKNIYVDFYLPRHNAIIEFNGGQHYYPVEHFGGEKQFQKQQMRDDAVKIYCKSHNIKLIEIPYIEFDKIEDILKKEIKENENNKRISQTTA